MGSMVHLVLGDGEGYYLRVFYFSEDMFLLYLFQYGFINGLAHDVKCTVERRYKLPSKFC